MSGLSESECEAIFAAGDHHPDLCDCDAYVIEQAFAEDCCCQGLLDTFDAVEEIVEARVAAFHAEAVAAIDTHVDFCRCTECLVTERIANLLRNLAAKPT